MRPAPTSPSPFRLAAARALLIGGALAAATALSLAPGAGAAPAKPAGRAVLSTVPADVPGELIGEALAAEVGVRARVAPTGLVDSAAATDGDERLRVAAESAVRWWVFAPARSADWVTVRVPFRAAEDDEPLRPDVIALARQAEDGGDWLNAAEAWVGVLARLGRSPAASNEWAIREHAIAAARRLPSPPRPGDALWVEARGAREEQLRTVARADHADLVARFDRALAGAPWWDEPYLWRAGSLAGSGRVVDALRSLKAYRLATTDSAGAAFAAHLIDRLAAADSVGVVSEIQRWRVPAEKGRR